MSASAGALGSTYAVAITAVLAQVGSFWLAWPLNALASSGPAVPAAAIRARLERFEANREKFSALVALIAYYGPALWVVSYRHLPGGTVEYLRGHLLDGFGCAVFAALGWRLLDRGSWLAGPLFDLPTAGIAAASAFIAGAGPGDIVKVAVVAYIYSAYVWGKVLSHVRAAMETVQLIPVAPGPDGGVPDG